MARVGTLHGRACWHVGCDSTRPMSKRAKRSQKKLAKRQAKALKKLSKSAKTTIAAFSAGVAGVAVGAVVRDYLVGAGRFVGDKVKELTGRVEDALHHGHTNGVSKMGSRSIGVGP